MIYLTSFTPLCFDKQGLRAIQNHGIPPFVDASSRREPDLESEYPSISALCRGRAFAPRLQVGDQVVYITKKEKYFQNERHWRLVAILKIIEKKENHVEAAAWYRSRYLKLPANCMVEGNQPLPIEYTSFKTIESLRKRDEGYKLRSIKYSSFLICEVEYRELYDPPIIREKDMYDIFGRVPGTRNPPSIKGCELDALRLLVK